MTAALLFVSQGSSVQDQVGYDYGFRRLLAQGAIDAYENFPLMRSVSKSGWTTTMADLSNKLLSGRFNMVLFQHFHYASAPDLNSFFAEIANSQRLVIGVSCGDPFTGRFRQIPTSLADAARHADVTFLSSLGGLAASVRRKGAKRVELLPLATCDVRLSPNHIPEHLRAITYDLTMVGNLHTGRNPFGPVARTARRRRNIARSLASVHGARFGLYGSGWDPSASSRGPVPYEAIADVARTGRIAFDAYPNSTNDYYLSDRPFILAGAGIPLVLWSVPGISELFPTKNGPLYIDSLRELHEAVRNLLSIGEPARDDIGRTLALDAAERHLASHRASYVVDVLTAQRGGALQNVAAPFLNRRAAPPPPLKGNSTSER